MPSRAAKPMMWATGRATTASNRPVSAGVIAAARAKEPTSERWLSSTPLGLPVVPDV
jgi:hypothetical protein